MRKKKRLNLAPIVCLLLGLNLISSREVAAAATDGTVASTVKIAHELNGGPTLSDADFYGFGASEIGDIDADGVQDMAVGAFGSDIGGTNRGAVYIQRMNADGTVKAQTLIAHGTPNGPTLSDSDGYGQSIAGVGDLNGDGIPDIVVSAFGDDTGGTDRGAAYIHFLNADGTVIDTVKIAHGTSNGPTLSDGDFYGVGVAGLGDLDSDGVPDIAVGANNDDTGGTNRGAIYVHLMNATGSIKSTTKIAHQLNGGPTLADSDLYGRFITALGDLDSDNVTDIAVAAQNDDTGGTNRGAVYVHFMNPSGSVKGSAKIASGLNGGPILNDADFYGQGVAGTGDLNADGVPDMAVGATGDDTGGTSRGAFYIQFMNADGTVASFTKIAHQLNGGPNLADFDIYGISISVLGDYNGDGVTELAVGAYLDDTGGTNRGAIYIHTLTALAPPPPPTTGGTSTVTDNGDGTVTVTTTATNGLVYTSVLPEDAVINQITVDNGNVNKPGIAMSVAMPAGTTKTMTIPKGSAAKVCVIDGPDAQLGDDCTGSFRVSIPAAGTCQEFAPGKQICTSAAGDTLTFTGLEHTMIRALFQSDFDQDQDGVDDELDWCAATDLNGPVPTHGLGPSHMGDQTTISGCNASQIIACLPGKNNGLVKHGLSPGRQQAFAGDVALGGSSAWTSSCVAQNPNQ